MCGIHACTVKITFSLPPSVMGHNSPSSFVHHALNSIGENIRFGSPVFHTTMRAFKVPPGIHLRAHVQKKVDAQHACCAAKLAAVTVDIYPPGRNGKEGHCHQHPSLQPQGDPHSWNTCFQLCGSNRHHCPYSNCMHYHDNHNYGIIMILLYKKLT